MTGKLGNVKQIPLTRAQVAIVDDEDYEWLSEHKWYANWAPKTRSFYANRNVPTGLEHPRQRSLRMHNAIWQYHNGPAPEGLTVDHADRDSLNNCLSN